MFYQTKTRLIILALAMLGLLLYGTLGGYYASELVTEIAILAILAISLDIVAGFGGMVSLGHGAIMGVAAYIYGVMIVKFGFPPLPSALLGIIGSTLVGAVIGRITGRISGIFFIMATLAFGQMLYSIAFKSRWLGGDDGMAGLQRFDLSFIGIDMNQSAVFVIYSLLLVLAVYFAASFLLQSAFGRTLCGIHQNEERMSALGVNTVMHRTWAMGFSSSLAGIGGILAAQHILFISPGLLFWTASGDVLIVLILGGLGTLIGPLIGAIIFVLLKAQASALTDHWHLVIGVLLVITVLLGTRGLYGQFEHGIMPKLTRIFRHIKGKSDV